MVRLIKQNELPELIKLYRQLHPSDQPAPPDPVLKSLWDQIINNPMLRYFVAETQGKLVSTSMLAIIPNLTRGGRPFGLIENVVTDKNYRRQNHGIRVLNYALDYAWEQGCYKVKLLAEPATPAVLNFYQKAGFKAGEKVGLVAKP